MESWIWLIIALITLIIEVTTPSALISIWFSVGALFAYVASILNLGLPLEIVVFITMSVLSFFGFRPFVLKFLKHKPIRTNADRYIGMQTRIVEDVYSDKWGAVSLEGIRWSVRDVNHGVLSKGTLIEVVALEGAKLVVKQVL